ncbi:Rz-like spanin [Xanthomonas phage XcP1]|uniref:Uncharacterized protein n=1 Tax=Xanthomonas phage XcP1 TaxID=2785027 RepID=A0A3S7L8H7_9CAUD|nr:Rz-like spanin [Xanthomonas phage XcP1]AWN08539.1 hypothetical protein XcP1_037 [Xanthomonas phage XcP1]
MKTSKIAIICVLLASSITVGCAGKNAKGDSKQSVVVGAAPEVQIVEIPVYVRIDEAFTEMCKWVDAAPLSEAPSVARGRKKCLQFYEENLKAIRAISGTKVDLNKESK